MNKLLKKQKKEIKRQYKIFDKNISLSRTDLSGNITYVTDAFCTTTGYKREELIGKNHRLFKDKDEPYKPDYKDLWLTITSGHTWSGEFHNLNKDCSSYWVKSIISPIFDAKQNIVGYEGIREDMTIRKVLQEFNKKLEAEVLEQTQEIKKSEIYIDTLFDINPNIAYVLKDNKLERVNRAFLEFTQSDSLEVFLQKHECICDIFEEKDKKEHFLNNDCTESHYAVETKVTIKRKKKNYIFNLTTQEFTIENEKRYLIILEDITELEKISVTDKLTGLYNRVKIDDEISKNYQYYEEFRENFSLILIDIDFFKAVNDNYGHLIGDEVLKIMALTTKNSIRSTDILARWGGEEFMVICPDTDAQHAFEVAQNIRKNIELQKFPRDLKITISAGVSDINSNKDISSLLEATDKALYKAKDNGRNRVEI
jgi:diguanylate cyclase (GGDEF)-like protein/PAS domain S-box-containing protein